MSGRTPSSSDLDVAKTLADRLKAEQDARANAAGNAGASYTRFSARPFVPPAASLQTAPIAPAEVAGAAARAAAAVADVPMPPVPSLDDAPAFGPNGFNALLDWCLEATAADCAFIVDDRGLPVADRGSLPADRVGEVGTRLVVAFDQVARMGLADGPPESMVVQIGASKLSAINVDFGAAQFLAVGIVGPREAGPEVRRTVNDTLRKWMGAD